MFSHLYYFEKNIKIIKGAVLNLQGFKLFIIYMSFRKFGGVNFSARHNAVSSNLNSVNNLFIKENFGQTKSYINYLSDFSGNLSLYGSYYITENLNVNGNVDISGNLTIYGDYDFSGNVNCNDISCNNVITNDISCNNVITNDISCNNVITNDISCNNVITNDISCNNVITNDISCNNIITNDISCNNIITNDISCNQLNVNFLNYLNCINGDLSKSNVNQSQSSNSKKTVEQFNLSPNSTYIISYNFVPNSSDYFIMGIWTDEKLVYPTKSIEDGNYNITQSDGKYCYVCTVFRNTNTTDGYAHGGSCSLIIQTSSETKNKLLYCTVYTQDDGEYSYNATCLLISTN